MRKNNLHLTEDGSHSVYSENFDALFHSKHGAIQESQHVFIEAGLKYLDRSISVLEMGFGTGLNALLTLMEARRNGLDITYHTVEAYPLSQEIVSGLNYISELEAKEFETEFMKLHTSPWNQELNLPNFLFTKFHDKLEEVSFHKKFDLVYYDAFAPQTQAELWTPEIFLALSKALNPGAVLVSYCAKGSFKRALMSAGFSIEKIPGPPGKREMIRATYEG